MNRWAQLCKSTLCGALALALALGCRLSAFSAEQTGAGSNRYNVVILLDASDSMKYTDPSGLRHEAIKQFAGLLAEQGNLLGGVVFHTDVEIEQDLVAADGAEAKFAVTDRLSSIPPTGYTNIGGALRAAVDILEQSADPTLPSVIVFLSDGNTLMPTEEETSASLEEKAEAIQRAREGAIRIYTVCLNHNDEADVTEMDQISSSTGGEFLEVHEAGDLKGVFNVFYNMIYDTSTVTLLDETFPEDGLIETEFYVPGIGVEEVNIVIGGSASTVSLRTPTDEELTQAELNIVSSQTFTLVKLTDIIPGNWTLSTQGVPGDAIIINMVYNTNLEVVLTQLPVENHIGEGETLTVQAVLASGGVAADSREQYDGFTAELQVLDAYGELIRTVDMPLTGDHFEARCEFEAGAYFYQVRTSGHYIEKLSERAGPLTVIAPGADEFGVNTPPTPVETPVEHTVWIWPFTGGGLTIDLSTLATDEQEDTLRYNIASTSFLEGSDYTLLGDILTQSGFSLRKGAYTVRATDSGGLYCDIEIIVKSYNVGVMAMIGLGFAALIALAIFGILLYLALTKPFRGEIAPQSCVEGVYRGTARTPRRGRCKLSVFGIDNVGLNNNKSYFQATGQNYIWLVTDVPVYWNGQKTGKVRIQSGTEVTVSVGEADTRSLHIRFDSRMRAGAQKRPHRRPPRRPGPRRR